MPPVLQVHDLRKSFGDVIAVDGVSFEVSEGEIFGFLGPNGAGKTTTISMVCGLLQPSDGEILVDGLRLAEEPRRVKERLGVVPQEVALYDELTARENLVFWGGIYGMKGRPLAERVDELLALVGLEDQERKPVKHFSGGMKRRLNLALGIVHDPKLILLDEPTVGIDPQARRHILDVVKEIVGGGRTVLYTTHYLEEAEDLCDRLAIIDHGRILALGSVEELQAQVGEGALLTVSGTFAADDLQSVLQKVEGLRVVEVTDHKAMLLAPADGNGISRALEGLFSAGMDFDDVNIKEPNLEDLFLKLTGRELRD